MNSKEYLKKTVRPELISEESISVMLPTKYEPIFDRIIANGGEIPITLENGVPIIDVDKLSRYEEWIEYCADKKNENNFHLDERPMLLLVYVAICVCEYPDLAKRIEAIYNDCAEKYYLAFTSNAEKNHYAFSEGNMLSDLSRKKVYSVLVVATEDEEVFSSVKKAFFAFDVKIERYLNQPCKDNIRKFEKDPRYTGNDIRFYAHAFFCYYLAKTILPVDEWGYTHFLESSVEEAIDFRENCWKKKSESIKGYSKQFDNLNIDTDVWKTIRKLRSFSGINEVPRALGVDITKNKSPLYVEIYDSNTEKYVHTLMNTLNRPDVINATSLLLAFDTIASSFGLTPQQLIGNKLLSKEEQMLLLKAFAYPWDSINNAGKNDFNNDRDIPEFDLHIDKVNYGLSSYITAFILLQLVKRITESKDFFTEHSNETMFSMLAKYREKADVDSQAIATAQDEIKKVHKQLKQAQDQLELLLKDKLVNKESLAPYIDEIRELRKTNERLEQELAKEKKMEGELFALRELAFDAKSEYVPPNDVNPAEVINEMAIVVIGGHINWRNNLKKKYSNIQIYDGHIETADLKPLEKADFVFLNVSNMSHGMYYRVMKLLREKNIPFDYLGRTVNQELYEKEMADILIKHRQRMV